MSIYEINAQNEERELQLYAGWHNSDNPLVQHILASTISGAITVSLQHFDKCYGGDSGVFKAQLLGPSVLAGELMVAELIPD